MKTFYAMNNYGGYIVYEGEILPDDLHEISEQDFFNMQSKIDQVVADARNHFYEYEQKMLEQQFVAYEKAGFTKEQAFLLAGGE